MTRFVCSSIALPSLDMKNSAGFILISPNVSTADSKLALLAFIAMFSAVELLNIVPLVSVRALDCEGTGRTDTGTSRK